MQIINASLVSKVDRNHRGAVPERELKRVVIELKCVVRVCVCSGNVQPA